VFEDGGKALYTIMIKIDDALPWIELKGAYQTRSEAKKAAKENIEKFEVKIVFTPEQRKTEKPLAMVRTTR